MVRTPLSRGVSLFGTHPWPPLDVRYSLLRAAPYSRRISDRLSSEGSSSGHASGTAARPRISDFAIDFTNYRTISTEQWAPAATAEDTLPTRKRSMRVRPRAPVKMQSAP